MAFSELKKELMDLMSAEEFLIGDLSCAILGVIDKAESDVEERELVQFVIENFWLLPSNRKIELKTALSRQEFNQIVEPLIQNNLLEDLLDIFQKNNNTPQDTAASFIKYLEKFSKKECAVILNVAAISFLPYIYFPDLPAKTNTERILAIVERYHRQFMMIDRLLKQASCGSHMTEAKILKVIESIPDWQARTHALVYLLGAVQKMSAPMWIIPIVDPRALQNAIFSNPADAADADDEPLPPVDKNKLI